MSGRRHVARLAVAAGLVAGSGLLTGYATAQQGGCSTGAITTVKGGWDRISAPHFSAGPAAMRSIGVSGEAPGVLFATNGVAVARSLDGGCTWRSVFDIGTTPSPSKPFSVASASVVQIATTTTDRVYLLINDAPRLHVMISTNLGRTWTLSDVGLASAGTGKSAHLVPTSSPGMLYLLAHAGSGAAGVDVLYVSTDDGATWTVTLGAVGSITSTQSNASIEDIAVDPGDPQSVWAATTAGLVRSADAGRTWAGAGVGGAEAIGVVQVMRNPGEAAHVLAFERDRALGFASTDGGESWLAVPAPARVDAVTWGYGAADVSVLASGNVYQLSKTAPATWLPIWRRSPSLNAITANHRTPASVYACDCGAAGSVIFEHAGLRPPALQWHGSGPAGGVHPHPVKHGSSQCMPDASAAPTGARWHAPHLTPASTQLSLAPGQHKTVHYVFHQSPRELDMFVAADAGPRSEFSHCPLKFGMVAALDALVNERNIRSGLAGIGDYPGFTDLSAIDSASLHSDQSNTPYKLERALGTVDQDLYNAIARQKTWWDGGNPQGDQGDLTALMQAALGEGKIVGLPAAPQFRIPGGLQAGFAPTAYKVLMHVAGNYFNDPTRSSGYPGPMPGPVKSTLHGLGIHQEGIWVNNRLNKQSGAYDAFDGRLDLTGMAVATEAISRVPIDCNGDGIVDVQRGDPLVCTYIAPAEGDFESHDPTLGREMRRLVEVLVDKQPMRLVVSSGSASVAQITPAVYPRIDSLLPHVLRYDVTYRCRAADTGQTKAVSIGAMVGNELWASALANVTCGAPVTPPPHRVAGLVPPPPPPVTQPLTNPGPVNAAQPAPNPAPNPAQAPQAQPQPIAHPAAVPAVQQEPQLATQEASRNLQANEPMTALPMPNNDPLAWAKRMTTVAGVALFAMGAVLSRRVQHARAIARSSPMRRRSG